MSIQEILNFIPIDNRVATSGQPTQAQLEAVRAEGYEAVVNLAPSDAANNALPGEAEIVSALGMSYHHIPVAWSNPRAQDFGAFSDLMDSLKDKKVLVHCAANFRVTVFYALYAMAADQWPAEQADKLIAQVWESRADYRMDEVWKSFVEEMRNTIVGKG